MTRRPNTIFLFAVSALILTPLSTISFAQGGDSENDNLSCEELIQGDLERINAWLLTAGGELSKLVITLQDLLNLNELRGREELPYEDADQEALGSIHELAARSYAKALANVELLGNLTATDSSQLGRYQIANQAYKVLKNLYQDSERNQLVFPSQLIRRHLGHLKNFQDSLRQKTILGRAGLVTSKVLETDLQNDLEQILKDLENSFSPQLKFGQAMYALERLKSWGLQKTAKVSDGVAWAEWVKHLVNRARILKAERDSEFLNAGLGATIDLIKWGLSKGLNQPGLYEIPSSRYWVIRFIHHWANTPHVSLSSAPVHLVTIDMMRQSISALTLMAINPRAHLMILFSGDSEDNVGSKHQLLVRRIINGERLPPEWVRVGNFFSVRESPRSGFMIESIVPDPEKVVRVRIVNQHGSRFMEGQEWSQEGLLRQESLELQSFTESN